MEDLLDARDYEPDFIIDGVCPQSHAAAGDSDVYAELVHTSSLYMIAFFVNQHCTAELDLSYPPSKVHPSVLAMNCTDDEGEEHSVEFLYKKSIEYVEPVVLPF